MNKAIWLIRIGVGPGWGVCNTHRSGGSAGNTSTDQCFPVQSDMCCWKEKKVAQKQHIRLLRLISSATGI